jgi:DNA-directed RNA polymerase subunit M/transcription elongation factor TFIIS
MPSSDCDPGEWYFCYKCKQCRVRHVLFRDLSQGKAEINATYILKCSQCGFKTTYEAEDIERYQHPAIKTKAG